MSGHLSHCPLGRVCNGDLESFFCCRVGGLEPVNVLRESNFVSKIR